MKLRATNDQHTYNAPVAYDFAYSIEKIAATLQRGTRHQQHVGQAVAVVVQPGSVPRSSESEKTEHKSPPKMVRARAGAWSIEAQLDECKNAIAALCRGKEGWLMEARSLVLRFGRRVKNKNAFEWGCKIPIFIACLKQIFQGTTKFWGTQKELRARSPNAPLWLRAGFGDNSFASVADWTVENLIKPIKSSLMQVPEHLPFFEKEHQL